jgi:hypothetical protein
MNDQHNQKPIIFTFFIEELQMEYLFFTGKSQKLSYDFGITKKIHANFMVFSIG